MLQTPCSNLQVTLLNNQVAQKMLRWVYMCKGLLEQNRRVKVAFGEKLQQNCWLVVKLCVGMLLGSLT